MCCLILQIWGGLETHPSSCKEPAEAEPRGGQPDTAKARGLGFPWCRCASAPRPPRKASRRRWCASVLAVSSLQGVCLSPIKCISVFSPLLIRTPSHGTEPTLSLGQLHLKIPHRVHLQRTYFQIKSLSVQADVKFWGRGTLFTPLQGSSGQWLAVGRRPWKSGADVSSRRPRAEGSVSGQVSVLTVLGGIAHPPRAGPFRTRLSAKLLKVR